MNWSTISRVVSAFGEISQGFLSAISAHSDAGASISTAERVHIAARVAGVWADDDAKPRAISKQDLILAFQQAGWDIYDYEEKI
jgi:hypothetical protein